jgi:radical SAM protein with 4Fe4S-binding SPASM domain
LSEKTVLALLKDARRLYNLLLILTLTGGEPFLYRNICQIIQDGFDVGFSKVRVNSNGTIFPNQEFLDLCSRYRDKIEIQFTLLGVTSDSHDSISTVRGSFDKSVTSIKRMLGTEASVSCVLMKSSILPVDQVQILEKNLGVKISLSDVYPIGRAKDNFGFFDLDVTADKRASTIPSAQCFIGLSEEKRRSLQGEFPPELPCGKSTFSVSANGDLLPCTLLQDVIIGNLFVDSIDSLLTCDKMLQFQNQIAINSRETCCACELKYVCENKCPAVSLYYGGKLGMKSPFCSYY